MLHFAVTRGVLEVWMVKLQVISTDRDPLENVNWIHLLRGIGKTTKGYRKSVN